MNELGKHDPIIIKSELNLLNKKSPKSSQFKQGSEIFKNLEIKMTFN